jgi:hypothetical protein
MKTDKFQLRGNTSVCAGTFHLRRGRAPAHLRGNIAKTSSLSLLSSYKFQTVQGKIVEDLPSVVNTKYVLKLGVCMKLKYFEWATF